ncbi:nitrilase-related carbon-nitrogen hydrolase [Candidatus Amarolinea dominans]|uniref:nitrilase-related carbon-nitrogen hydrolase n=1 Tax=Candidatus Amarolinea dominans TaxID=3140696 RepID=UPI0031CC5D3F
MPRPISLSPALGSSAADQTGAQLIVLPETVTTGFVPTVGPLELWDAMDEIPGRLSEPIQKAAQAVGAYVVLPSYERGPQRGVVYNSARCWGQTATCSVFTARLIFSPRNGSTGRLRPARLQQRLVNARP